MNLTVEVEAEVEVKVGIIDQKAEIPSFQEITKEGKLGVLEDSDLNIWNPIILTQSSSLMIQIMKLIFKPDSQDQTKDPKGKRLWAQFKLLKVGNMFYPSKA